MPLEVNKKDRESSQSLIRRFSKNIKRSGILLKARESMFKKREKSDQMKKRSALRREELRKEYKKLKKMSKPR